LLKGKEIQEKYRISRQTLTAWRKLGLPVFMIGRYIRYDEAKVEQWIIENKQ